MLQKDDLARLLDYTVWANHRVMRTAAILGIDDFRRDLGSSHGGVRGTLTHIASAEWIWLERFKGVSPPKMMDEAEFPDIVALRSRWRAIEEHRNSWFWGLKATDLEETVRYRSTEGKTYEAPLWRLIQHVTNHSTHHRGQVTTLLRQLGAKPVATDMLLWYLDRKTRGAPVQRHHK